MCYISLHSSIRMTSSHLHINQVSYLNPLFDALRHAGVNLEKVKHKSDIKYFDINKIDAYVPVKLLEEFLVNTYEQEGLTSLDPQLVNRFYLGDMGEFGEFLLTLPDALSMVNESIKLEPMISTNCRTQLILKGIETFYYWKFVNKLTAGSQFSEEFCFVMVLNGLQPAFGNNYPITSIHIPSYRHEVLKANLPVGNYNLVLTKNHYAIGFPTKLLGRSQLKNNSEQERPVLTNDSYRSRLNHLFNGLEDGVMPSLELLAMYTDMSTRGLNRHLFNEGTNFRELVKIHQLNNAIYYLEQTQGSIYYISSVLGYDHTSNFIRAFKNWTGVTPSKYRFQMAIIG